MINFEIERKYLVKGEFKHLATKSYTIKQAYICSSNGKTVRIRTKNDKAILTIKGPSEKKGMGRLEFETEVSLADAASLFSICEHHVISKTRYIIPFEKYMIEVDEFQDENEGLILAEIELESLDEQLILPDFLGVEVTALPQFYNSFLSKKPFTEWNEKENFTPHT